MMESGPSPIILIGQKTTGDCPKGNFGQYWAHTYAYDSETYTVME